MRIPLFNKLNRRNHKEIALLQDQLIELIYSLDFNAVLHGGTAIWRCYNGNRFSEDLDFYFKPKHDFENLFKEKIYSLDFNLIKFKKTKSTWFVKISSYNTIISLEIALRNFRNKVVKAFEKTDGTFIDVFTLSPEDLFIEKLNAFRNRKLIRDFYDVFHLRSFIKPTLVFKNAVLPLLKNLPKPVDERILRNLIFSGIVPSFDQMNKEIKWFLK